MFVRAISYLFAAFIGAALTFGAMQWRTPTAPGVKAVALAKNPAVVAMDDARIKLAEIEERRAGPATLSKRLAVPGSIAPDAGRVAHVSVKLPGTVSELHMNIGDDVTKGDVIAVFESRDIADAKSEYLAARLADELAQDLATRDRNAWEGQAIPEQQLIRSRNAAAQAGMRLDIARQKLLALGLELGEVAELPVAAPGTLRNQNIRAPISGRVVERKVELGAAMGRDNLETEMFVIVDLSRVWVEMAVASGDLALVKEGQAVTLNRQGAADPVRGQVIFVSPLLDKDTRTARVVAAVDNADGRWRPGSFATAEINVGQRDVAVSAPAGAVQTVDGRKTVFVRTPSGFEKREVALGQTDGATVEIKSGLAAGEKVAVSNTFALKAELSKPSAED